MPAGDAIDQVIERERALLTPQVRRSAAWLDTLLDSEFGEIGASGRRWTRSQIIAELVAATPGEPDQPIVMAEVAGVRVAPDVVLLTYLSDPGGRPARRSSLWRRDRGTWRMLFHQGTCC